MADFTKAREVAERWKDGGWHPETLKRITASSDIATLARCVIAQSERVRGLEEALARETAAVDACHEYWKQCALAWHRNDGRVGEATTGGAVVVGDNLDVLADDASRLVCLAVDSRTALSAAALPESERGEEGK